MWWVISEGWGFYCLTEHANLHFKIPILKEKFSKELKKGCNRTLIMKAKQCISVDPLYYPTSFYSIFFEQNCLEMSVEDLKSLIKEKKLTQEQEHIVPQSWYEREEVVEIQKLGFEDIKDLGNYIDTYGNLLSLEGPLNSEAKDLLRHYSMH